MGVELVAVGDLHQPPEIHHRHAIRDMADHGEVVGDEQEAQIEPRLQVLPAG